MNNILLINSSLNGEQGNSSQLTKELLEKLAAKTTYNLIERDLSNGELPHLTQQEMAAWMTPVEERDETQIALAAISDTFVDEVLVSNTIVIGMPMYNFSIPSTFKAWVDRIARAGITFQYTEQGPVGLLESKKVIIIAARGGMYLGTPKDTQTQYLKDFFGFIGITDVEFVYAEGLAMPTKSESLAQASKALEAMSVSLSSQ